MNAVPLTGLDGSNPLAYLAALGVLVALDDSASKDARPRLSWHLEGAWQPTIHAEVADLGEIVRRLDEDRQEQRDQPALHFTYDKKGKPCRDVKPSPKELNQCLKEWAPKARPDRRLTVDWFTAFVSEGAVDNNGAAKPTALHFTAGQQTFLGMALHLVKGVRPDHLREALEGPWTYDSKLPVLGWDNTETRDYALRASNPADEKKQGNPGADWLALRGLRLLPTVAVAQRQRTPGVEGRWKHGRWAWPLWTASLTREVVESLLMTGDLRDLSSEQRERRGIAQVFEVRILRSDQGGYGSVTPARVA